jgi:hypothetical protein
MKTKILLRPEYNFCDVTMKYDRLVVFIRYDSAEIWGFRHGLTLIIRTLKLMASTGVFVRVVSPLKRSIRSFSRTSSTVLAYTRGYLSYKKIVSRGRNLDVIEVQICARKPAAYAGDCAMRRFAALPL